MATRPKRPKPTKADVNELAEWLHATYLDGGDTASRPWEALRVGEKMTYRRVARRLLEDPPDAVRRAISAADQPAG